MRAPCGKLRAGQQGNEALSPYEQLEPRFRRSCLSLRVSAALGCAVMDAFVAPPMSAAAIGGARDRSSRAAHDAESGTPDRARGKAGLLAVGGLASRRPCARVGASATMPSLPPPSLIARPATATARAEVSWVEARKPTTFQDLRFCSSSGRVVHLVLGQSGTAGSGAEGWTLRCWWTRLRRASRRADSDTIFKALRSSFPPVSSLRH